MWKCAESTSRDDVVSRMDSFSELEDGVCRYKTCTETLSNKTMFLFGLYALNTEHLVVCKAIRLAQKIGCTIHGVLVDGVLVRGRRDELNATANAMKRPDGSPGCAGQAG